MVLGVRGVCDAHGHHDWHAHGSAQRLIGGLDVAGRLTLAQSVDGEHA
jgi:hypothetical protein